MKDVIVSIKGIQNFPHSGEEPVELITNGKYSFKDGIGKLRYMESELTGMKGTETQFEFGKDEVILSRTGTLTSQMVFKKGKKSTFLYDTPFGSSTMSLDTHTIESSFGPRGGKMEVDYVVDFDHAIVGRNTFTIDIKEQGGEIADV